MTTILISEFESKSHKKIVQPTDNSAFMVTIKSYNQGNGIWTNR